MRVVLALLCGFLAACASTRVPSPEPSPPPLAAATPPPPPSLAIAPAPKPTPGLALDAQTVLESRVHHVQVDGHSLDLFVCDDRKVHFSIADQAEGPGSQWKNAEVAARAHGALASINGGFFTPEGAPLGRVIESRQKFGRWNRSSSLTSGVFEVWNGRPRIRRSASGVPDPLAEELLQTGPFLIENGSLVAGLSQNPNRPRSFLLWDGRHHWAFGVSKTGTLASLARVLASQPVPGLEIKTALNLDGGTSSQLWIGSHVTGGPGFHRPIWTKPVRNFILAHEKK